MNTSRTMTTEETTMNGSLVTVKEACRILHVHSNTLRRWSNRGLIRAYRLGPRRERRFRLEDVLALLSEEAAISTRALS